MSVFGVAMIVTSMADDVGLFGLLLFFFFFFFLFLFLRSYGIHEFRACWCLGSP